MQETSVKSAAGRNPTNGPQISLIKLAVPAKERVAVTFNTESGDAPVVSIGRRHHGLTVEDFRRAQMSAALRALRAEVIRSPPHLH
jgi:hypothetical protein